MEREKFKLANVLKVIGQQIYRLLAIHKSIDEKLRRLSFFWGEKKILCGVLFERTHNNKMKNIFYFYILYVEKYILDIVRKISPIPKSSLISKYTEIKFRGCKKLI